MEYEMLKHAAEKITMPEKMKQRIAGNCKVQISKTTEEHTVKNNVHNTLFRKPAAVFAALAICLSLAVTALAVTGVLQGYFRDITDYRGAVVGTSYEQATDEISLNVTVNGDTLRALVSFANPQKAPYSASEQLGIAAYQIVNAEGNVVAEGAIEAVSQLINGQAAIQIPLNDIESGNYKLIVSAFVSEKKADQSLEIKGYWEADFCI